MKARAVPRDSLCATDRDAMYSVLRRHFDGVDRAQFHKDLEAKNWVILLDRPDGSLAGFSTLRLDVIEHAGEREGVVYSGDTIIDRADWGSSALPRSWIRTVLGLAGELNARRWYWLLIVSGFRTYRFLPVFFREFYPRYDASPAPATVARVDRLAGERFGTAYDPATGIVRFAQPQRLRGSYAEIPPSRHSNPHVEYFGRLNPGHAQGDELVCLTELAASNLTRAGLRMLRNSAV